MGIIKRAVPKIEFGRKGPYQPTEIQNVRLLFIYHTETKDAEGKEAVQQLKNGIADNKYPLKPMNEYIRQQLYH